MKIAKGIFAVTPEVKLRIMEAALNSTQLEILNLFSANQSEEDLKEIKSLLIAYLSDKIVREADKAFVEREYTNEIFKNWKKEHFRKSA